jgi:hypothetical protein
VAYLKAGRVGVHMDGLGQAMLEYSSISGGHVNNTHDIRKQNRLTEWSVLKGEHDEIFNSFKGRRAKWTREAFRNNETNATV